MKMYDFSQSRLIKNQRSYDGKLTLQRRIIYLVLLFLAANILSAIPVTLMVLITSGGDLFEATMSFMEGAMTEAAYNQFMVDLVEQLVEDPVILLVQLFTTAFTVAAVLIYAFAIEKRSGATLGLSAPKKSIAITATLGALLGAGLLALAIGICVSTGSMTLSFSGASPLWLVGFFLAFLVQGFSEELLLRGYIMTALLRRRENPWFAVLISSIIFAVLHGENNSINVLALLNLFLFGVLAALLTLRTGNLWMATTLHALWNFAQGNLFGISVSGAPLMPTLWSATLVEGRTLTHGGGFGIEGGCATTVVLLLALLAVLYLHRQKKPEVEILE